MRRPWLGRARVLAGVAVLAVLVWRVGLTPFLHGLSTVDARTLLLGLLLGVPTTLCCAWRWTLVSDGLGVRLPLRRAVAACYRSQLINVALPGGVLGDVHRGVRHGLRSVVWERFAGQVVLVTVTAGVLLLAPTPTHRWAPLLAVLAVAGVAVLGVGPGMLSARTGPGVLLASLGALLGPVATFVVAARAAGVTASVPVLVPLALLVLLAMALPLNVAGWGPREGVAAWAFAATGLGAGAGVATAVVYGLMTIVAVLPGALLLRGATRG